MGPKSFSVPYPQPREPGPPAPCFLCHAVAAMAVPCWLCHAGCATLTLLCWICLSYQEKVLELARPQLALVPLGYSVSLLLWDPHGPGTQLPFQSVIWQVRAQGRGGRER